jgi:hypothetical protein
MYLQKGISRKNFLFYVGILKVNAVSGSGSGSISHEHGSADPDPDPDLHQNVMNPQHCKKTVPIIEGKDYRARLYFIFKGA